MRRESHVRFCERPGVKPLRPTLPLRAGFATSAAAAGAHERDIMQHTRHKSEQMVRRYIRKGSLFKGNLVDTLGF
jgi:integrase